MAKNKEIGHFHATEETFKTANGKVTRTDKIATLGYVILWASRWWYNSGI